MSLLYCPHLMIKRFFGLTLGILILIGATELHQLLKLPFLIQHYIHHRNESSSLSFLDFLKIHYSSTTHPNDNDDNEDHELPFKSTASIFHIDTPVMEKRITDNFSFHFSGKRTIYYPEGILSHQSSSVFHPPKIV